MPMPVRAKDRGHAVRGRLWQARRSRRSAGFTLMELLLVVLIISVLAALVAPGIISRGRGARIAAAKQQIVNFETALKLYYLDNDFYPTTEQGFASLVTQPTTEPAPTNWQGPYLEHSVVPNDPWSHPYVFTSPGVHNPESFDILSYGPDGKEGGGDDVANYQVEE